MNLGGTISVPSTLMSRVTEPAGGQAPAAGKILDAARQFESLLIAQLLETMRTAARDGWLATDGDQAGARAMEFAEQELAQGLASQGGLGLANLIASGLAHRAGESAAGQPGGTEH